MDPTSYLFVGFCFSLTFIAILSYLVCLLSIFCLDEGESGFIDLDDPFPNDGIEAIMTIETIKCAKDNTIGISWV